MKAKMRFVKTYFWSIALNGCTKLIITTADRKRTVTFEVWCYRRITGIIWTESVKNEGIIKRAEDKKLLCRRRFTLISHMVMH